MKLNNCPNCGKEVEPHGCDIDWVPTFYDPDSGTNGTPYHIRCTCGFYFSYGHDYEEFVRQYNGLRKVGDAE